MKAHQRTHAPSTSSAPELAAPSLGAAGSNQDAVANLQSVQVEAQQAPSGNSFAASVSAAPPPPLWVEIMRTAPASGSICDLAGGSPVQAGVDWIKVDAGGPVWIHLSAMSSGDQAILVDLLRNARGSFSMTASGRLILGQEWTETFVDADARDGQKVLDGALARDQDAEIFDFLNGGEEVLKASQVGAEDREGWKEGQTKPGSWYNFYEENDGVVSSHSSRFDERKPKAPGLHPTDPLQGLKDLIVRCLDISGLKATVGNDPVVFEQVMTERFEASSGLGDSAFKAVLDQLWSYVQTGAMPDGSVDIGRLQALVRALDPQIQLTADTNTPFTNETFDVGDTELARGDGHFGRATMLSLLHLFGEVQEVIHTPADIGTTSGGTFGSNDYFVHDDSRSMTGVMAGQTQAKWPTVVGAVDASMGLSGGTSISSPSRTVGTMEEDDALLSGASAATQSLDMADVLQRAWAILQTHGVDETAFADLLGLGRRDVFPRSGTPDWRNVMSLLNDGQTGGPDYGGRGESPIKAMLKVLTQPSALASAPALAQRVQQGPADTNTDPVRLNGVMDEDWQALEYLGLLRELASKLNVDIRFIVAPERADAYVTAPVAKLVFVDPADIVIDPADHQATVTWTQNGVQSSGTFDIDHAGAAPSPSSPNRFRAASLGIHNSAGQNIQGVDGRTR